MSALILRQHRGSGSRGQALVGLALVVAAIAMWPGAARAASSVEGACRTLGGDDNYKVRVQAALVLGRLGAGAAGDGAVACLSRALGDQNKTVRAVAAQALGQIGDPAARSPLQALARRDPDPFVRAQSEKALAMLGRAGPPAGVGGGGKARPKPYLDFGPFTGGTKNAPADAVKIVRDTLERELGKMPTMTLTPPDTAAAKAAGGFLIDGNVTRLDDAAVAGTTETSCAVKVMVARWPSKSIISWTSAEASVQSGSRPRDKENARRECLEATAGQLAEDLAKFLKAQGG